MRFCCRLMVGGDRGGLWKKFVRGLISRDCEDFIIIIIIREGCSNGLGRKKKQTWEMLLFRELWFSIG